MNRSPDRLATGWEPETPVADTLLRSYLHHFADLNETFALAAGGHALRTDDVAVADYGRAGGYFNSATVLRPPTDWDALLHDVEAAFGGASGEAMLWSPWPIPDLRGRRWRLSGHPPLLARPPVNLVGLPTGSGAATRRIDTPSDLARWERAAADAYPLAALQGGKPGSFAPPSLLADPRLSFWLGEEGDRAVAAALAFTSHGIGSLAFGATHPAARSRGHWRQLAIERLRATPELWMTGVFSDLSRPGAERLGFVPLLRFSLWILDRRDAN